jgi:hypothetical protein
VTINHINGLPAVAEAPCGQFELLNLRIVSAGFGIATVRIAGFHLRCLIVTRRPSGRIVIRPPKILSRDGQHDYGWAYVPQPGVREAIEAAVGVVWDHAEGADKASDGA